MTTTQEDSSTFGGSAQAPVAPGARIELDRLERIFGSTRALDGFSLSIQPAEFLALLGPSGCGKTTALRVLAGFERLDGGRVVVDGKDLSRVSSQKRDMGMVFQSYSLFPNMNAIDNVAYGLRMRRQRSKQRRKKAGDLLELVGLGDQRSKYPHQMSGGQQQRVALARALAIEPQVLLLDEPLSALDARVRAELRDEIRALQRRLSITTVFVTHDQEEALSLADRVCVMSSGHNEQTASPADLYARPATPFVAEFVGVSSRVPVQRTGSDVVIFGQRCPIRLAATPTGGDLDALLRPEDLTVDVDPSSKDFVTHRNFLGATTRLIVLVGEIPVRVDLRSDDAADIEPGTRVRLSVIARDVLVAPHVSTSQGNGLTQ
jgi:putative spermidine/putrescine transport system ATP-binding protein